MRHRVLLACVAFIASTLVAGATATPRDHAQPAHAPGVVLVAYDRGTPAADRAIARASVGAQHAEPLSPIATDTERLTLPPDADLDAAIAQLERHPHVRYAELDTVIEPFATSNDPYYLNDTTSQNLWGMHGDGLAPHTNAFGSQADEAWAADAVGSREVYVGVVDEGVQITHPDLDANIWTNPFDPVNGDDDDGNGYVDDTNGWDFANGDRTVYDGTGDDHGTHVAGTIGAEGANGVGVAGVNWRVTMIPVKFLGEGVTFASDGVAALDYLTDLVTRHGLRIVAINASWGGDPDGSEQALADAIARAGDAGILFVAAAGNGAADNDADPTYPSSTTCTTRADTGAARGFDCVVSVAAADRTGGLASFSNYGDTGVDLGAPGVDVYSTVPNGYGRKSGTSMSAPHVVGAIALCASIDPSLGARGLRAAVTSSVASTPSLVGVTATGGRLDIGALVDACTPPTGAVTGGPTGLAASAVGSTSLRLDWGDGATHEQTWQIQTARDADCGSASWSPAGEVGTGQGRLFVEGLAPDAPYCFRVRAVNGFGGGTAGAWELLGPVRTAPPLTPYTCAPTAYTWLDATTGARRTLPDDGSIEVGIGFTFRLYGTPFTKVRVTSNGVLVFGSTSADRFVNTPIPATIDPDGLAAGFWDDLDPSKGGAVWTKVLGASPNRRFVTSWNAVPIFNATGSTLSFQIVLDEATGRITYTYRDVYAGVAAADRGASATVGVESPGGEAGTQVSYLQPSLEDETAIACAQPTPVVTTTSLPSGTAGTPYAATLTATGGTGALTWSWTGTPPPGLTLDPAGGRITGTPTQSGPHPFGVTVTDSSNPPLTSAAKSVKITVKPSKSVPANLATAGDAGGVMLGWWPHKGVVRYEWCLSTTTSCGTGTGGTGWRSAGTATQATVTPSVWSSYRTGRTYHWQMRVVTASSTVNANGGTWWRFSVPA